MNIGCLMGFGVCDRCLNSFCVNQDNYMKIFQKKKEKKGTTEKYITSLPYLKFLVELVETKNK